MAFNLKLATTEAIRYPNSEKLILVQSA